MPDLGVVFPIIGYVNRFLRSQLVCADLGRKWSLSFVYDQGMLQSTNRDHLKRHFCDIKFCPPISRTPKSCEPLFVYEERGGEEEKSSLHRGAGHMYCTIICKSRCCVCPHNRASWEDLCVCVAKLK